MNKKKQSRWKVLLCGGLICTMVLSSMTTLVENSVYAAETSPVMDDARVKAEWEKSDGYRYSTNLGGFWKNTNEKITKIDKEKSAPVYISGAGEKIEEAITIEDTDTVSSNAYDSKVVDDYKTRMSQASALNLLSDEDIDAEDSTEADDTGTNEDDNADTTTEEKSDPDIAAEENDDADTSTGKENSTDAAKEEEKSAGTTSDEKNTDNTETKEKNTAEPAREEDSVTAEETDTDGTTESESSIEASAKDSIGVRRAAFAVASSTNMMTANRMSVNSLDVKSNVNTAMLNDTKSDDRSNLELDNNVNTNESNISSITSNDNDEEDTDNTPDNTTEKNNSKTGKESDSTGSSINTTETDSDAVPGTGESNINKKSSSLEADTDELKGNNENPEDDGINLYSEQDTEYDNFAELYYTVEKDEVLGGYYRQYYIWNANQLAYLLYCRNTNFENSIGATEEDAVLETGESFEKAKKLGIRLLCDLDLGGKNEEEWEIDGNNATIYLVINGQGNAIYNGNMKNSMFLGETFCRRFVIEDLIFSNMYIPRASGLFGTSAQYAYLNNVNFEKCVADEIETTGTTIVFGYGNIYIYMKDCTISDSYVHGGSHSAPFTSYNSPVGADSRKNLTYIDDSDSGSASGYYFTEIPEQFRAEDFEAVVNQNTIYFDSYESYGYSASDGGKERKLTNIFPTIMENCGAIDCEVYIRGGSPNHSGGFISCTQGFILFRQCFSNTKMYCATQAGIFLGACIGSGDGFYCQIEGKKTWVNSYFKDCYTSGVIEGTRSMGGFVGMIFQDSRSLDSDNRGICVFCDCYSTTSVGMQYSGKDIGGFVGHVEGNIGRLETQPGWTKDRSDEEIQHRFINCYAAGEVGSITTDVYTGFRDDISVQVAYKYSKYPAGGFLGYYAELSEKLADNDNSSVKNARKPLVLKNCYYDKQTTAMRERDIGGGWHYSSGDENMLAASLKGLTGVYTEESESLEVQGLTDLTGEEMGSNSVWSNVDDYYPQLRSMTEEQFKTASKTADSKADQMRQERAMSYYYCSLTSTATVLLDHYDEVMDIYGEYIFSDSKLETNRLVYDTVRDITRKFIFTSTSPNGTIKWDVNTSKNENSGFKSQLGEEDSQETKGTGETQKSGNQIRLEYDQNNTDTTEVMGGTAADGKYTVKYLPNVITIVKDGKEWRCTEFASGKQWVTVTCEGNGISQTRDLRLLPRAYLNAGDMLTVNVKEGTDKKISNSVYLQTAHGTTQELNGFRHYIGVSYAISDYIRMGTSIYDNQILTKYSASVQDDTDSFVFYGGYLLEGSSNAVGLNDQGEMYDQKFDTKQSNMSTQGKTMVKVYHAVLKEMKEDGENASSDGYTVERGSEISGEELKKFDGTELFDVEDNNHYYFMTYYWRLNDGRWLEDDKLVYVTADNYNVEMITGILEQKHTVDETQNEGFRRTAIDQYVTDDIYSGEADPGYSLGYKGYAMEIEEGDGGEDGHYWYKNYPSDEVEQGDGNNFLLKDNKEDDTTDQYYNSESLKDTDDRFTMEPTTEYKGDYNYKLRYGGDNYYAKSVNITTDGTSAAGWRRNTSYKLTTLVVEVFEGGKWTEMKRINTDGDAEDYNNAAFSHTFKTHTVKQDPITKLFTVTTNSENEAVFHVRSSSSVTGGELEKYIKFEFEGNSEGEGGDTVTFATQNTNLRVIALFRGNEADVAGEKEVLFGDSNAAILADSKKGSKEASASLENYDKNRKIDNNTDGRRTEDGYVFQSASDDKSYAVLAGDILTYRVKLENVGALEASEINVQDAVPDGCTYIEDSCKIYRQKYKLDSGTKKYEQLEDMTGEKNYSASFTEQDQSLQWHIPQIKINEEYFAEFQVKVKQLPQDQAKLELVNTAQWDFTSVSGDMKMENGESRDFSSIADVLAYVDLDIKEVEDNPQNTYKLTIKQKTDKPLENFYFKNIFPEQFTAYTGNNGFEVEVRELTGNISSENGNDIDIQILTEENDTRVSGFEFTMEKLDVGQGNGYELVFYGKSAPLEEPKDYYNSADREPIQKQNMVGMTYNISDENGKNPVSYSNTITKNTRLTNQVSTDVTWLYLDIEKTIQTDDREQSFLMKIEYDDSRTESDEKEAETYYTRINCTKDNGDHTWTGTQRIRVAKRGTYKVTEMSDWSFTDYEFESISWEDPADRSKYLSGTKRNTSMNGENQTLSVALPRIIYSEISDVVYDTDSNEEGNQEILSYAFPTAMGTDESVFPKVKFANKESIYAYRSAQAFAENKMGQ